MARFYFLFSFQVYLVLLVFPLQTKSQKSVVHQLDEAARQKPIEIIRGNTTPPVLHVFCYEGDANKRLGRVFSSATFKLLIEGEQYQLYRGHNASSVVDQHLRSQQSWWFSFLPWQTDTVGLAIFKQTCVGVESRQDYAVQLQIKAVDPWILMFLLVGLVLFVSANRLSKNVLFYYGTGVSVGIVASLLVLVFVLSRFLPKKHYGAYAVMVGGWSIALYVFQKIWENVQLYLDQYFHYVVGYLLTAGFVAFAVCYYKGPPKDPRSLNLVQWGIQAFALLLMYFGTCIPVVSGTLIALVLLGYNFPTSLVRTVRQCWIRRFPPKIRFLTEEEYIKQGNEQTQRALEELRQYCQSPNCDAWKTVSRLKSPHKFADWVEGASHVSETEFEAYDTLDSMEDAALPSYLETDDEDEIDFRLSSP